MIGHLGNRVSALLDGHLDEVETERAWSHVYACHSCRDQVEREGWVKNQLSRLSDGPQGAPADLKGFLRVAASEHASAPSELALTSSGGPQRTRRVVSVATVGGGAVGAAMMGVLALGAAPADAPGLDRRAPVTSVVPTVPSSSPSPSGGIVPTSASRLGLRGR